MAEQFSGKAVVVTGAARGLGLAVARRFVRAGASVMLADVDEDRLGAEVRALDGEGWGGRAQGFAGDLREKLAMTNLMAATIDAYDGIDVLVNAGRLLIASSRSTRRRTGSRRRWRRTWWRTSGSARSRRGG